MNQDTTTSNGNSIAASLATFAVVLLSLITFIRTIRSQKKSKSTNQDDILIHNQPLSSYKDPPFPPNLSFLQTSKAFSSPQVPNYLLQWFKDLGTIFQLNMPLTPFPMFVLVGDPDVSRQILNDRKSLKTKAIKNIAIVHDFGDDILTSEGLFWKHSRKNIAVAFSSNHIKRMNSVVLDKVKEFTMKLDEMVEKGESFDVGDEMLHLTLSVISEAAFQYTISFEERCMVLEEFDIIFREYRRALIPFRWKLGFLFPEYRRARQGGKKFVDFGMKLLNSYRKLEKPVKGTVIDLIACNENYKSDKERASDIVVLFFAGHDTTAYSLAWTLFELAKNQSEQMKLHKELLSLPEEDRSSSVALNAVIKESQRFRTITPVASVRTVDHDVYVEKNEKNGLEHNIKIMAGSLIMCSPLLLHYNDIYHKDPEVFNPSRWTDLDSKSKESFMPFSIGRRNCVGQSLANAELNVVLSNLCSDYHFSIDDEGQTAYSITYKLVGTRLFASKATKK